jgi:hypothetical protein
MNLTDPPAVLPPLAGLIDRLILDYDLIDLVVWLPHLSWPELAGSLGALVACKVVSDQVEAIVGPVIRGWIADRLVGLATWIRPVT